MRETYRVLPVYAGDVSGACGALYELEGMCVMHDPSGCNSTYNTFDETRWYEKDSLIFLSGLTDLDAVMGNDKKLIRDVEETARALQPKFIALMNSPIPYLNGTDFSGICRVLEKDLRIPAFYVPTNGMHDYTEGAGQAFQRVAEWLVEDTAVRDADAVNILGYTPLDFPAAESEGNLRNILETAGFRVLSNWSVNTNLDSIRASGRAQVNLVVSAAGLYAAEALRKRFGTPWVAGIPVAGFADAVLGALGDAVNSGENQIPHKSLRCAGEPGYTLVGEPVMMTSLAAAIQLDTGVPAQVLCPTELRGELLGGMDASVSGEEGAQAKLCGARHVVADPLYRQICPRETRFHPLPHLAFSGRLYRSRYPNPFGERFADLWRNET